MADNERKYLGLEGLQTFLDNLKVIFAALSHSHTLSDISDYTIDTELSSASTNPVANSTLNEEFETVATAIKALETSIDDKADTDHNHDDIYYTETEIDAMEFITTDDIDEICGQTIYSSSEVEF